MLTTIERQLAARHDSCDHRISLAALARRLATPATRRRLADPANTPKIPLPPPRREIEEPDGYEDGQAKGSSVKDQEDEQKRRERRQKEVSDRAKANDEDEAEVGSPSSEKSKGIGPMGDSSNVVGVMGRSPSGMDAFKSGLRKQMRKMSRATTEALSGFVGR